LTILGAIAGAVFEDNVKDAARDAGFYVIEQSGDTMKIEIPEGWKPAAY
jgi:predicted GTPase